MGAWTAVMLLPLGLLGAGTEEYKAAYQQAESDRRPLVVLVGAPWCPGCRTMKQVTIPRMQKSGKLAGVVYTEVDSDQQPGLADRILRGNSIPQLVVYYQDETGWRRAQLTGAQSEASVEALIKRAIHAQTAANGKADAATVATSEGR